MGFCALNTRIYAPAANARIALTPRYNADCVGIAIKRVCFVMILRNTVLEAFPMR